MTKHTMNWSKLLRFGCAAAAALSVTGSALAGTAASTTGTVSPITSGLVGDGTMGVAAKRAMERGALRLEADLAAKAKANAVSDMALGAAGRGAADAAAGGQSRPLAPVIAQNIFGQFDTAVSPPDTTGATGTTRYIQLVNRKFGIYSRAGALISSGTLNTLSNITANNFDPQVIWDGTTNRFYYLMDSVVSSTNNRLAFGFSKTSSPNNGSTDFCHYSIAYGAKFPDYPKLGDNRLFMIFGVNNFQPSFVGSDLIAVRKPVGTGTIATCPSLGFRIFSNVRDSFNALVFTPVPSNGIDTVGFGYAVSRNGTVPSNRLWVHPISAGSATTLPTLSAARLVTVPNYLVPPDAVQPTFTQRLDTLDARPWQAVLSVNPQRGNGLSMWLQQTAAHSSGNRAEVRVHEIRPNTNPAVLLRTATIASSIASTSIFNAAASSDRRVTNAATGDDVLVGYNASGPGINPRILVGSSVAGGAFSFTLVQSGAGPYRDFSCAGAGQTCRWGDYAGATPDPLPQGGAVSAVGFTNQYSPGGAMPTTQANWRTKIFHARP